METFLLDNSRSNFIAKKLILRRSCGMRHTLFEQATVYLSDLYHYFMPGVHEIVINTSTNLKLSVAGSFLYVRPCS